MRLDLFTSGIWQTNSTLLSHGGACVVIDPAYFPREIDAIAAGVHALGRADAVVFTHGHWDHVMGHGAFPGAPVWMHHELDRAIRESDAFATRALDRAREFDSRWYVERTPAMGYRWPDDRRGIDDDDRIELAGIAMRALHVPGHTADGLGLVVEETGTLIVGDHLSPCEIPFVDDVDAYRATLRRLIGLLSADVHDVIPGHGPRLTATEALEIARADLDYLNRLADVAARARDAGADADHRDIVRSIPLPRAAEVVGMDEAHQKNWTKALLRPLAS